MDFLFEGSPCQTWKGLVSKERVIFKTHKVCVGLNIVLAWRQGAKPDNK